MERRPYRQPFPILESFDTGPGRFLETSNAINARMVTRQREIDVLQGLQEQDRITLSQVRESIRQSQPKQQRRRQG